MGGTAGHMSHPFNLCEDGDELIDLYEKKIPNHIVDILFDDREDKKDQKDITLKLDGVNASFRIVKEKGTYRPVIDRGSISDDVIGKKNEIIVGRKRVQLATKTKEIFLKDIDFVNNHNENTRFDSHGLVDVYSTLFTVLRDALKNPDIQELLESLNLVNKIKKINYTNITSLPKTMEHGISKITHIFDTLDSDADDELDILGNTIKGVESKTESYVNEVCNYSDAIPSRKHAIINIEAIDAKLKNIIDYSQEEIKNIVHNCFKDLKKSGLLYDAEIMEIEESFENNKNKPFIFFVINGFIEKTYDNKKKVLSKALETIENERYEFEKKLEVLKTKENPDAIMLKQIITDEIKKIDIFRNNLINAINKKTIELAELESNHINNKNIEGNHHNYSILLRQLNKYALKHNCAFLTRLKIKFNPDHSMKSVSKKDILENFTNNISRALNENVKICNETKPLVVFLKECKGDYNIDNLQGIYGTFKFDVVPYNPNQIERSPTIKTINFLNKETLYNFVMNEKRGEIDLVEHIALPEKINNQMVDVRDPDVLHHDKRYESVLKSVKIGCAIWYSTKVIGDAILKLLYTDGMGSVHGKRNHEGIVLDNLLHKPMKITGNFIDRFTESGFRKNEKD